ncbi:hypothetical protein D3C72_1296100 [compost metagenome]
MLRRNARGVLRILRQVRFIAALENIDTRVGPVVEIRKPVERRGDIRVEIVVTYDGEAKARRHDPAQPLKDGAVSGGDEPVITQMPDAQCFDLGHDPVELFRIDACGAGEVATHPYAVQKGFGIGGSSRLRPCGNGLQTGGGDQCKGCG